MYPILFHIWGPIAIQSFGFMIAIGSLVCLKLLQRDKPLMELITRDQLIDVAMVIFVASFVGGRLMYAWEMYDGQESLFRLIIMPNSGFSILGSLVMSGGVLWLYLLYRCKFYVDHALAILDRFAIYMPLLYSISRIGCFLAGCCYGCATTVPWAITYTNSAVFAPCYVPLHPTQLYSASLGFIIFLLFYFVLDRIYGNYKGALVGWLFICIGAERFLVDFLRADRTNIDAWGLSTMQWFGIKLILFGAIYLRGRLKNSFKKK